MTLFGPERTGLDNDEVAIADAILTFPVNPAYASLNLAQAVLLSGYEYFSSAHGQVAPFEVMGAAAGAARDGPVVLRIPRRPSGGPRFLPSCVEAAGHAAQHAQHVPSHAADAAGRAHGGA